MVLGFRLCMNGFVFQSVLELFLLSSKSLVAAIMPVVDAFVFQSVAPPFLSPAH